MNRQPANSLQHIGVLVTRPAHQAQAFIELLEQAGDPEIAFQGISFPSIDIQAINDEAPLNHRLQQLDQYQLVIFISVNAVEYALAYLDRQHRPLTQAIAAIGKRTAQALNAHQLRVSHQPEQGFNSEALLAMEAFQQGAIQGKKILIFRGMGGREHLADSLRARGAMVDYAEVYQRCLPEADIAPILELWSNGGIQLVTVTSNEALKNLYYMVTEVGQKYLTQTDLVVASHRCAELAQQLGFTSQILVASSATDQAMLEQIHNWQQLTQQT